MVQPLFSNLALPHSNQATLVPINPGSSDRYWAQLLAKIKFTKVPLSPRGRMSVEDNAVLSSIDDSQLWTINLIGLNFYSLICHFMMENCKTSCAEQRAHRISTFDDIVSTTKVWLRKTTIVIQWLGELSSLTLALYLRFIPRVRIPSHYWTRNLSFCSHINTTTSTRTRYYRI